MDSLNNALRALVSMTLLFIILNTKSACLISEFYTGWLTHWGEKNAKTGADFTAAALEAILRKNGSAVLYVCLNLCLCTIWKPHYDWPFWIGSSNFQMAHGGSNFGFYNGANTGADEADYKPDLTSYDYVRNFLTDVCTFYCELWYACTLQTWFLHMQDAPIREAGDVDNSKFNGTYFLFFLSFSNYQYSTF